MLNLSNLFSLLSERGAAKILSDKTRISTGNISDWKSRKSNPNAEELTKLAKYFNCSVNYLLGLTDTKQKITQTKSNIIYTGI